MPQKPGSAVDQDTIGRHNVDRGHDTISSMHPYPHPTTTACWYDTRPPPAVVHIRQHDPDATTALLDAIPRGQLDHVLARLTLAQREGKLRAKAVRDLTRQGVTVVDDEPNYHGDGPRVLTRLRAADAPTGQALAPDEHVDCPGHIAYVEVSIYEVDPDDGTDEESEVSVTYGCADPAAYGHLDLWDRPGVRTVPLPDEDVPPDADEQARAERQARDARRELIRLNKEADVLCTCQPAAELERGRQRAVADARCSRWSPVVA
jgi:hypothetical protein